MSDGSQEIGNPLQKTLQSGGLGTRQPITSKSSQPVASPQKTKKREEDDQPDQVGRVKRTFMMYPDQAIWLKVQAALESREMSEIVKEALELYAQRHPRGPA